MGLIYPSKDVNVLDFLDIRVGLIISGNSLFQLLIQIICIHRSYFSRLLLFRLCAHATLVLVGRVEFYEDKITLKNDL